MFTDSSDDDDDDTVYELPKPITHGAVKLRRQLEPTLKATLHRRQQLPLTTSHATPRSTVTKAKKSVGKKPFTITPGTKHPSALQAWYPFPKIKPPGRTTAGHHRVVSPDEFFQHQRQRGPSRF